MSKVEEYYTEMDELDGTNDVPEPSDKELSKIETEMEFSNIWNTDELD